MAVFDDTQPWPDKLLLYPHQIKWRNNTPVPAKAEPERVNPIAEEEPLKLECEHFLHCIGSGRTPVTDGREGVRVLRILNASQRSLDENGKKIFLSSSTGKETAAAESVLPAEAPGTSSSAAYYVQPTAAVDDRVKIGKGTKIWHFSHILSGSQIGENCNIGQNVVIGPEVTLGQGCKIQNNVSIYKGVTLEDGVFCGPSMVFTNVYNPRAEIRKMSEIRPTLVKRGATIGANSTIICGVTLGRYCFIGAGAVVTKNVPDHALVLGNPAKQVGWACRCGERLTDELECLICGKKFSRRDDGLLESGDPTK
jgi:UDP-2-acetamido-3-amino-2,3-dideoxy-glucuronate N-acetyltransferase